MTPLLRNFGVANFGDGCGHSLNGPGLHCRWTGSEIKLQDQDIGESIRIVLDNVCDDLRAWPQFWDNPRFPSILYPIIPFYCYF